ncbi:BnaA03g00650D [Brassica napus]|uniref:BnaA03g00650D protein n=1 Tax=Brassica napus TaxID=3708 RepID=A0A078FE54_BRANA|nr:BnaA03g00650D [Brassica napus]
MLQHQIAQSPAILGLTGHGSPSVQNPTPSRHGHPPNLTTNNLLIISHLPPPQPQVRQAPLRGALPPAPQDEQMRASQL